MNRIVIIIASCLLYCSTGYAVTSEQVSLAVLGEALHDPESMRYMAHAVINRVSKKGSFKGIYGYKKAQGVNYSPKTRLGALKAVNNALVVGVSDPTFGATHWLSDYDLAHCRPQMMAWRFKMVETAYQGQTHFYREA